MQIGNRHFDLENHCYIMGILNVTPDSFSDGGQFNSVEKSLKQARKMIDDGADIIDVGGESSRPGHEKISVSEELDRIIPIIESLSDKFDIPISIDTCKSDVAVEAIKAGAHLVNDIWGFKSDPNLAKVTAQYGVPCCLMHNRHDMDYTDFISDMLHDLMGCVEIARLAGVAEDKIILDPGIGFAKTYESNLEAINKIDVIKSLGYPVLLGVSRKRVVGYALDLPVQERVEGSVAAAVVGLIRGACIVRVHDVKETYRAIKMTQAILG
jgi:dihydropteroate synthase